MKIWQKEKDDILAGKFINLIRNSSASIIIEILNTWMDHSTASQEHWSKIDKYISWIEEEKEEKWSLVEQLRQQLKEMKTKYEVN